MCDYVYKSAQNLYCTKIILLESRFVMGNRKKLKNGIILILPAFLFILAFMIYPMFNVLRLSFFEYSPLRSREVSFIGFENYSWLVGSEIVSHSLYVTILFTVISVAIEMVAGLLIATLLAKFTIEVRSKVGKTLNKVFVGILILPFAAPAVAAAVAWKMLLHPQFGPVNDILGIEVAWFTNYPLMSVIFADAWKMTPIMLFLFYAAIMSIDPEQFEAAKVDGVNNWQEFRYLTLPSILPVLTIATAFRAVDAFTKIFDIVYMTTGGGPGNATEVFPLLIWKTAFSHLHFGKASALAVVAILISILLGAILVIRKRSN